MLGRLITSFRCCRVEVRTEPVAVKYVVCGDADTDAEETDHG
jgi:hypothetical protein